MLFKLMFKIPAIENHNLFRFFNALILIGVLLSVKFLNMSLIEVSVKEHFVIPLWFMFSFVILSLVFLNQKKGKFWSHVFNLIFFYNRTLLFKVVAQFMAFLLEVFILIKFYPHYMKNGGFDKTSFILYLSSEFYFYIQIFQYCLQKHKKQAVAMSVT